MIPNRLRLDVHASPTRCPYCHASCAADEPNIVCNGCLARHHRACWEEAGKCGTCTSERPATVELASPAPRVQQTLLVEANVARLDREWALARERYCRRNKRGALVEPSAAGVAHAVVAGVFGAVWTLLAAIALSPAALFGAGFTGLVVSAAVSDSRRRKEYEAAEARYRCERAELLSLLDEDDSRG